MAVLVRFLSLFPFTPADLVVDEPSAFADAVVVLEGSPARIARALALIQDGYADTLIYPGARTWSLSNLDAQADELGVDYTLLLPPRTDTQSTWEEALVTRDVLMQHPTITSLILVTSSFHTYRSRWTFQKALPAPIETITVAAQESWWTPEHAVAELSESARQNPRGAVSLFRDEQRKFTGYFFLYGWRVLPPLLPILSPDHDR